MTTTEITRTATTDDITYSLILDGDEVSTLVIDAETRMVLNVETAPEHQGCGYARTLWEAANAEGQCFHALDTHRTADGEAFALSVGGDTIDIEHGRIDVCGCEHCDTEWIDPAA